MKLTTKQVNSIRNANERGIKQSTLAKKYNVTPTHISYIVNYKRRANVTNDGVVVETTTRKIPSTLKEIATRLANTGMFNTTELQKILLGSVTFDQKTLDNLENEINTKGAVDVRLAISRGKIIVQNLN